jgi:hypothetical protein
MPGKRQILECLSRLKLIEIAGVFEITGISGKPKDIILDSLMSKRSIPIQDILNQLNRDDLKSICDSLGIDSSGKEKGLLVHRICGDEPGPKPLQKDSTVKKFDKEHTLTTKQSGNSEKDAKAYVHEESTVSLRPEIGTQAQFKKKKPPRTYKYDSSLSPNLEWDGQNPARDQGEALIKEILDADTIEKAKESAEKLKSLSQATVLTPVDYDGDGIEDSGMDLQERGSFIDRMLEVLRQSPVIQLPGNKKLTLKNIRLPAKTLSLSAEALVPAVEIGKPESIIDLVDWQQEKDGNRLPLSDKPLAIVFGPESGAVSEKLVWEAGREATAKNYSHLLVIGFAIQPNARELVEKSEQTIGIPSTYIQMTPDLMMGDLLKNMRSSQIFSVCGLPDVKIKKAKDGSYQVELLGLDVFDPSTMEHQPLNGNDVPAWFLDTDYNGPCFHVCQAFFPRTGAWESLKKALKSAYEESVWDHLAGTLSEPFGPGEHKTIAVKVIDDRGNELLVTKELS